MSAIAALDVALPLAHTKARPVQYPAPGVRSLRGADRKARKRQAFSFGVDSERQIAAFLHAAEYKIIGTRQRVGNVEVDLIVARDDIVAFVEVKARRRVWDGLEAVTPSKMRRLARAADRWLFENPRYSACAIRFDIALVGATGDLEYLENAFEHQEAEDFVF